jgi:DNA-directed RNA polymerase subunit beta'
MGHIELAAPVAHIWYTRRVPSYLGLLLDISRRNLDRILYFAQYVIIRVDEQARSKALKRLDEELSRERARIERDVQEKVDTLRETMESQISEMRTHTDTVIEQMEQERDADIEAVMRKAQQVQRLLDEKVGKKTKKDILFPGDGEVIVPAGEMISAEHLNELNKLVEHHLNEIKQEIDDRMETEKSHVDRDVEKLRL